MVLYNCCMSLDHARAVERDGFKDTEVVGVTEHLPDLTASTR